MRTLTLRRWAIKNWFATFLDGERRYSISGAIAFEMRHGAEPDLAMMKMRILEVDAEFPWRDDVHPDAGEFKSIRWLSDGEIVIHNFSTPLKVTWFHIYPADNQLRKGQVYAYERYLAQLAKELAWQFTSIATEVRSVIEVRAATSFQTD